MHKEADSVLALKETASRETNCGADLQQESPTDAQQKRRAEARRMVRPLAGVRHSEVWRELRTKMFNNSFFR